MEKPLEAEMRKEEKEMRKNTLHFLVVPEKISSCDRN
jgi:hypothetical protein